MAITKVTGALLGNYTGGSADDTVVVGDGAGDAITTGVDNTFIGDNAGTATTEGSNNVAIGNEALAANTTGTVNTAVGHGALDANTTASYNTGIGRDALGANTTGDSNTAVGEGALDANTTASNNVAVGRDALGVNTTGYSNTAVGSIALDANTTGVNNVAMGRAALTTCTTGGSNVAIGLSALEALSTASSNVAVGSNAGASITTGVENTCIGDSAGDSITTANYNICIGHGTDPGNSVGYAINIGYDIGIDGNFVAFGKAGNIVYNGFTSNNSWTQNSDIRLKKNITTSTLGLNFINDLRPVTYNWKDSRELDSSDSELTHLYRTDENLMDSETTFYGFIAQEVKTAMENAGVSNFGGWNKLSNGIQGVSKEAMVIPLIKAVQELSAQVEELKAKIN